MSSAGGLFPRPRAAAALVLLAAALAGCVVTLSAPLTTEPLSASSRATAALTAPHASSTARGHAVGAAVRSLLQDSGPPPPPPPPPPASAEPSAPAEQPPDAPAGEPPAATPDGEPPTPASSAEPPAPGAEPAPAPAPAIDSSASAPPDPTDDNSTDTGTPSTDSPSTTTDDNSTTTTDDSGGGSTDDSNAAPTDGSGSTDGSSTADSSSSSSEYADEFGGEYDYASSDFSDFSTSDAAASEAVGEVNDMLTGFGEDLEALMEKQDSLLSGLLDNATDAVLSVANAAKSAQLLNAILTVNDNVELSPDVQNKALDLLTKVVGADAVSAKTANSVVSSLSAVATSAEGNNPGRLDTVAGLVETLSSSQASQLAARQANLTASNQTGSLLPALTASSPMISTLVQLDPPGSSRLRKSIGVNGSTSAFEPLPGSVAKGLGNNASDGVVTTFYALSFDPNGGPDAPRRGKFVRVRAAAVNSSTTSEYATTGVTRLAFSSASGAPLDVSNTGSPIRFTLPAVNVSAGAKAVCQFWDTKLARPAYSTIGCGGVPSPSPAGHELRFLNLTTPADSMLALLWDIRGSLLGEDECSVRIVDCGASNKVELAVFDSAATKRAPGFLAADAKLCVTLTFVGASASRADSLALALVSNFTAALAQANITDDQYSLTRTAAGGPNVTLCISTHHGEHYVRALSLLRPLSRPIQARIRELGFNVTQDEPSAFVTIHAKGTVVYPDPRAPFNSPAVACDAPKVGVPPQVLRVYHGTHCKLWRANDLGCNWDNAKQTFVGNRCVATVDPVTRSNATSCACRCARCACIWHAATPPPLELT
jgi:hypothetical protein